ncbi:GcrA cell cycle regulator [Dankookia rubra]|uniref:GcrA cell cycle regulator n=1 Tax=Dankookia rubra TaxID=1442381 RepID=A0A4R5QEW6_9PROT|nr:GcrA family cell cycle regulator [Dankookia rubra]TDH61536.1 GcrA cell cycle regulator [Dankookia rubra]
MDWTAEAIDRLRAFWAEGHSTAEIGRRMGISKNAVVGKAHRLNLPARPSPIRREAEGEAASRPAPQPRRQPGAMPAAAPSLAATAPLRDAAPLRRLEASAPVAAASVVAPAPQAMVVRPFPRASTRSCCWPLGEPGTPDFRFCTGNATPGKPYCAEHASVAYVRVRERREDAA